MQNEPLRHQFVKWILIGSVAAAAVALLAIGNGRSLNEKNAVRLADKQRGDVLALMDDVQRRITVVRDSAAARGWQGEPLADADLFALSAMAEQNDRLLAAAVECYFEQQPIGPVYFLAGGPMRMEARGKTVTRWNGDAVDIVWGMAVPADTGQRTDKALAIALHRVNDAGWELKLRYVVEF